MTVDWHIQGGEIGTKRSKLVAMPMPMKISDEVTRAQRSDLRVDRTPSLDHTSVLDRHRESDKQRRPSTTTIEITVSFIALKES